jgi:hypothetical protein
MDKNGEKPRINPQARPEASWLVPVSEFSNLKNANICFKSKVISSPDGGREERPMLVLWDLTRVKRPLSLGNLLIFRTE